MEMLISAAQAGDLVTYGKLASHLEVALRKRRISPRQMGYVAGPLMDRLLEVDNQAPLINLLVVRSDSDQPGKGANPYLRRRFNLHGRIISGRRREHVQAGLNEVWSYSSWPELFQRAFGRAPNAEPQDEQFDEDGKADNPKFGGLPESDEHKALKEYVLATPGCLKMKLMRPSGTKEKKLLSGDKMDVEFVCGARRIGVEVKSRRSGWADLRRGIYQCVKYRAVMVAQSGFTAERASCEAVLVTERVLPSDLKALALRLKVPWRIVKVNG